MKAMSKYTIACVDSDADGGERFAILFGSKYNVLTFNTPEEVLEFMKSEPVDLVVSELEFEGISGFGFLKKIKHQQPSIALVLYTASQDYSSMLAVVNEVGVLKVLKKPIEESRLIACLEDAISQSAKNPESARLHTITGTDADEIIRANVALRESEHSLRMAQIIAKMGSWEYNYKTEELRLSRGELALLNLVADERSVYSLEDLTRWIHPEDRQWIEWLIRRPDKIRMNEFEFRLVDSNGRFRYIRSYIKVLRDEEGHVTGILGTDRDITEQKETEMRNTVINDISRKLNANLSLHDFCEYTYEQLIRIKDFPNVYIATYHAPSKEMSIRFQVKDGAVQRELPPARINGRGLSEYIVNSRKGLYLSGDQVKEFKKKHKLETYGRSAKAWIGVPLISEDSVVGVLASQSFDESDIFSEQDLTLLSFIGTQIGSLVERHRAEQEIHQFERYFAISMDLLCILEDNGRFNRINPRFSEFSGHSEQALLSKSIFDFIHPDDVEETRKELEIMKTGTCTTNFINRYRCSDGSFKWMMWSAKYEEESDQIFAAAKDIDEQKRAKDIVEIIATAQTSYIGSHNTDGLFDTMMTSLLGVDSSELCFIAEVGEGGGVRLHGVSENSKKRSGKKTTAKTGILSEYELVEIVEATVSKGKAHMINDPDMEDNGSIFKRTPGLIRNYLGLPFFSNDRLIGVVGIVNRTGDFQLNEIDLMQPLVVTCSTLIKARRDDRAKRNTEKELRHLADIVSHSSDAIISVDTYGKINSWNQGAQLMMGYSVREAMGKHFWKLFPEDAYTRKERLFESIISGGQVESREVELVCKDGHKLYANMSLFPLKDVHGDITGVSGILRDITARKEAIEMKEAFTKKLEAMVQERTQELDEAKKELAISLEKEKELGKIKSGFVSTASHQFRTPLAVIQASLGVLDMQKKEMSDEYQERFDKIFTRIREHIGRMTDLMDEVLVIGKINSGIIQPVFAPTDLVNMCENLIRNYTEIQSDGRKMQFKVQGDAVPVSLDEKLMEHAISNLISNAFKYSEGAKDPNLMINFGDQNVEISVTDYGIGIPDVELHQIFEPFYRASNTRDYNGTGLGSAIAKEYIELNQGKLEVKSQLNKGSEFKIVLSKN